MTRSREQGHRAGLSRGAILRAAIRLADREGLAALSMRRLGAELGVEAMTLYHYIPNKNALLDGMVEQVVSEATPPVLDHASWRQALRGYATSLLAVLSKHPNLIPLITSQPAITPRNLEAMETALGLLHSAGFDLPRALDVIYSLNAFVIGQAALQAGPTRVGPQPEPGQAGDLPELSAEAFPLLTQAFRTVEQDDAPSRFDFALDALLSGFAGSRTSRIIRTC